MKAHALYQLHLQKDAPEVPYGFTDNPTLVDEILLEFDSQYAMPGGNPYRIFREGWWFVTEPAGMRIEEVQGVPTLVLVYRQEVEEPEAPEVYIGADTDEAFTVPPPWLPHTRFHKGRRKYSGYPPPTDADEVFASMCGLIDRTTMQRTTIGAAIKAGLTPCRSCYGLKEG